VRDVAIQPDDKVLIAGESDGSLFLARYTRDGSLDAEFAQLGVAREPHGFVPRAIALQGDGKIVVAGRIREAEEGRATLVRYTSDGVVDDSFGVDGVSTLSGRSTWMDVALQSDGKIVTVGGIGSTETVARFSQSGALDEAFGVAGYAEPDPSFGSTLVRVLVLADDDLFVFGGDCYMHRFNAEGTESVALGRCGLAGLGNANLDHEGRVLIAGGRVPGGESLDWTVMRRHASDGGSDREFGEDGFVDTNILRADIAHDVVAQPDGRILVVGLSVKVSPIRWRGSIVRYEADGSLDRTFSTKGKRLVPADRSQGFTDVLLQTDGRVVAVGSAHNDTNLDVKIWRFRA
jgi:uncharacterized delta-60 repeat protein